MRLHAIRNDKFVEQLGFVSKNSTSWGFLSELHDAGYQTAETWVARHLDKIGKRSSVNVRAELTDVVLNAPVRRSSAKWPGG
jgi:NTE family protein